MLKTIDCFVFAFWFQITFYQPVFYQAFTECVKGFIGSALSETAINASRQAIGDSNLFCLPSLGHLGGWVHKVNCCDCYFFTVIIQ